MDAAIVDDNAPCYTARFAWYGVSDPIVAWLWDRFSAVTGSKVFAGSGISYADAVKIEGMLVTILSELNRRVALVAKTPGDKEAATARVFARR